MPISYNAFVESLKNFFDESNDAARRRGQRRYHSEFDLENSRFRNSWAIGGAQGGSCWGDEAYPWTADVSDAERGLKSLERYLDTFPDMTRRTYMDIKASIETSRRHQGEYYGNYTDYEVETLNFRTLYDILVKAELI